MTQYPAPRKNNNKLLITILIVLCIMAVVALIGLVWIVASDDTEEEKNEPKTQMVVVYDAETGEEFKIPEKELEEYLAEGYVSKRPDVSEDDEIKTGEFENSVVLYRPDGTTLEVPTDDKQQYLDREGDEKYYEYKVIYIFNVEGDKEVISIADAEDYLKDKEINENGEEVDIDPVKRWYKNPVVIMYAAGDRRVVISAEEKYIKQYEDLGWHDEPVAAITKDGENKIIPKTQLEQYVADGWEEYDPKIEPCEYCGKKTHTTGEHPRCQYCDSTAHVGDDHPECSYCKIKTTHITSGHPCTRCRGKGHDKSDCTVSICNICGKSGHDRSGHLCTKCYGKGHDASTCTACAICLKKDHTTANHTCTKCYGKGHDAASCTVKSCNICQQQGHTTAEHKCKKCGEYGHSESSCVRCSYCGSGNHNDDGHPLCICCGSPNHTSTCEYCCTTSHTTPYHPSCSWCGRKDHTGKEHDAVIAAEAAHG